VSLPTVFQAREYRFMRAAVFVTLGAWGVVPVSHLLLHHSDVWAIRTAFRLDLLMGAIYVVRSEAGVRQGPARPPRSVMHAASSCITRCLITRLPASCTNPTNPTGGRSYLCVPCAGALVPRAV
jgi:hypothetical protein